MHMYVYMYEEQSIHTLRQCADLANSSTTSTLSSSSSAKSPSFLSPESPDPSLLLSMSYRVPAASSSERCSGEVAGGKWCAGVVRGVWYTEASVCAGGVRGSVLSKP